MTTESKGIYHWKLGDVALARVCQKTYARVRVVKDEKGLFYDDKVLGISGNEDGSITVTKELCYYVETCRTNHKFWLPYTSLHLAERSRPFYGSEKETNKDKSEVSSKTPAMLRKNKVEARHKISLDVELSESNDSEQSIDDSDQSISGSDQCIEDSDQCISDSNQSIDDSDQRIDDNDQCINDSDQTIYDSDQTIYDSDQTIYDSDQSINDSDLSINDSGYSDQRINESDQNINNSDQSINDSDQGINDPDESINSSDQSINVSDQSINVSDQSFNGSEQSINDSDESINSSDQSISGCDQSTNGSDQSTNGSNQSNNGSNQSIYGSNQSINNSDQSINESDQSINGSDQSINDSDPDTSTDEEHDLRLAGSKSNAAFRDFVRRGKDKLFDQYVDHLKSNKDCLKNVLDVNSNTEDKFEHVVKEAGTEKEIEKYLHHCWRNNLRQEKRMSPNIQTEVENKRSESPFDESLPVHIRWCLVCGKDGNLQDCVVCPAAFHEVCRQEWLLNIKYRKNPPNKLPKILSRTRCIISKDKEDAYICPSCMWGPQVGYDDIVWNKLGPCGWWPARVLSPGEVPFCLLERDHSVEDLPLKYYGTLNHSWGNSSRTCLFLPSHTRALAAADFDLKEAVMDAYDDYVIVYLT